MANALYDAGRANFLEGDLDWDANTIKFVFTDHADDTPAPSADSIRANISAGSATVATSSALASKTTTAGVADAADSTVGSVSGDQFESINLFQSTGSVSTDLLIAYIDSATGLPCTPNGGNITVAWDSGANKIFKL